jgi:hypothetical protein
MWEPQVLQTYRPTPAWSSSQRFWLQIQRSGFDSRCYQISWEVVSLEQGPLSLVSKTEELLERKSSGSSLASREYTHRDPSHWPRGTLYPQKFAPTSPKRGGHSVGIVRLWTQATEFSLVYGLTQAVTGTALPFLCSFNVHEQFINGVKTYFLVYFRVQYFSIDNVRVTYTKKFWIRKKWTCAVYIRKVWEVNQM